MGRLSTTGDWIAGSFEEMLEDERDFYSRHRERKVERAAEERRSKRDTRLELMQEWERLDQEIGDTSEYLRGVDSRKAGQKPVEADSGLDAPSRPLVPIKTKYRFSYREPERLTPDEARRRRFENFLNSERVASVSGSFKAQYARQRSEASAADGRRFHGSAANKINPRTVFGTEAVTVVSNGLKRHFLSPVLAIPCIQRVVRREVMFAKRKAGKGYRVPKVRSLLSNIGC